MESLWFREDDRFEAARIARAVQQIDRAADRYDAVGAHSIAAELRALAVEARFSPLARMFGRHREVLEPGRVTSAMAESGRPEPRRPALVPSPGYAPAPDLCVVVAFFNPCRSEIRTDNCRRVLRTLTSSGVPWRCVECAFDDSPFELEAQRNVIQVRSRSVLWQKERLLNLAIQELPDRFTKVAWIDADVCFSNPLWVIETSAALDRYAVVQPFEHAVRLTRDATCVCGGEVELVSFAALFAREPWGVAGADFWRHGHPGYAWAAQREWLERDGLYDAALSGTADHLMAHAFVGAWENPCMYDRIALGPRWDHFKDWCSRVYPSLRSRLGYVPGTVFSLWHGSDARNHAYYCADHHLDVLGFHPAKDLFVNASGAWEWDTSNVSLRRWALDYFQYREKDTAQSEARQSP
jgi:hypothetical protein